MFSSAYSRSSIFSNAMQYPVIQTSDCKIQIEEMVNMKHKKAEWRKIHKYLAVIGYVNSIQI